MSESLFVLNYYKEYGLSCTMAMVLSRIFVSSKNKSRVCYRIQQFKHKAMLNYLSRYYFRNLETEKQKKKVEQNQYPECIWTAWLQGEKKAPEVVKLTIASIRKHADGHKVIVITNENIEQYITIPEIIKKKHDEGIMGNAHYADVVRMLILEKYGGLWLDATMFLYEPIGEEAFSSLFYSVGFESDNKAGFISDHKWIVRIIGGKEESRYLSLIAKMLSSYWIEHNVPIDYFVFDYLIAVLYQKDKSFNCFVNQLAKKKRLTYELGLVINEPYNHLVLKELMSNKDVYTLSYRKEYVKYTDNGTLTNYGYLYEKYMGDN